jgi:hypothetical protein
MNLLHRAVVLARDHGIGTLVSRAGGYAERSITTLVHRVTVVIPYELYIRYRHCRYALWLLLLYLRVYQRLTSIRFVLDDPVSLRLVDPAEITGDSPNRPPIHWGSVEDGDWDLRATPFDDRAVPRALRLHYEEGVPWEETPLRGYFDEMMDRGGAWGYRSREEFHERVADIEALVESIRRHGYRTRDELPNSGTTEPLPTTFDEVTVDVGRDGEYLYRNLGQHRIAVAKLLELDEIPVRIGTYHVEAVGTTTGDDPTSRHAHG